MTVPVGRHTTLVIEPFAKLMRSHASGGSWSALEERVITLVLAVLVDTNAIAII